MSFSPGIIIQARRGSSRLPDKVVRPFFDGLSILEILIDRFKGNDDYKLIVATTIDPEDDLICELCEKHGVPYYRGSVDKVLERFYETSIHYSIDPVIRICSDNPFILPSSPGELLKHFRQSQSDYIGYILSGDRPGIITHFGLWAELLTQKSMNDVLKKTNKTEYLEHVTNYLYNHKNEFSIAFVEAPSIVFFRDDIRLTVDTESDFELARDIYSIYNQKKSSIELDELIQLIDSRPEWKAEMINSIRHNEK